jgi:glycosyltransferase involved in cell wall biosynthesis
MALGAARIRADLFHVVDHAYAHMAALLPKRRTIVTCHDLMLLRSLDGDVGFRGTRASVARFQWSVSFLRKVAHVICDSETTRSDVIRLVGVDQARTSVVPPGIADHFRSQSEHDVAAFRTGMGLDHRPVVLNVSTGSGYKNIGGVLNTVRELRSQGLDVTLVRVGRPLSAGLAEQAERLGLSDVIHDLGFVDEERLVGLYNAADVLLHPSFHEGFGWPPLEAMACGTPVVSSNTPALLEVVGNAALTAPADDYLALADAVSRALEPARAAKLRALGFEQAAQFTWARTLCEVMQRYDTVLRAI